jgi:hypothetical protein
MKYCLLLLFALCFSTVSLSQDIIVLRKNEQEIKCRIVSVSDTLLTYRLWRSDDTTSYTVKKFEIQSFMMDRHSQKSGVVSDKNADTNADSDLLGEYHAGTVVSGFVITNSNDTISGFITIKNVALNQVQVLFSDSSGKSKLYSVKDAKGYGYMKIHYDRIHTGYKKEITNGHKTKDGNQFLHRAVDGPSKLYRFYTLHFGSGPMNSYNQDPPTYLGKLSRQFVITNPKGDQIFTKGRTLKGTLNRIYYDYPKYKTLVPVETTTAAELPEIVNGFNYWFENNR